MTSTTDARRVAPLATGGARPTPEAARRLARRAAIPVLLFAIVCGAAMLRVWALAGPPLSWDEGNNAYFAHRSLAEVLEVTRETRDTDPPVHRLALTLWLGLLGDSARNLRLLSSALGVATVLLLFHWGRWLAGPAVALAAATLAALSPVLVYYSREAKAYPFVTFFGLAAVYLWCRYLDRGQGRRRLLWLLYVLAEALALGAHYYAAFLIVAQGLWLAIDVARDRTPEARARALRWLGAQGAVGALLLPWVAATLSTSLMGAQALSGQGSLAPVAYFRAVLATVGAGLRAPAWAIVAALVVLGAGLVASLARCARGPVGLLASVACAPIVLGLVAQSQVPFFAPRFLLYTVPALLLLTAYGLSHLRFAGLLLGAGLVVAWLWALPGAYGSDMSPEEDMRPLAETLRADARPGDGVVVGYIWQEGILRQLAPGAPVTYHLGWFATDTVEQEMGQLVARHPRLWLVTYRAPLQHPQNPGGWWLEHNAARSVVMESGVERAVLYLAPPPGGGPQAAKASFEEGIELGYTALDGQVSGGEPLLVPLSWRAHEAVCCAYSVFVHLCDEDGRPRAQSDGGPVNGLKPFPQFAHDETVADYRALWLPPDLAPGRYQLRIGLYDPATGARLRVIGGDGSNADAVLAGEVQVTPGG